MRIVIAERKCGKQAEDGEPATSRVVAGDCNDTGTRRRYSFAAGPSSRGSLIEPRSSSFSDRWPEALDDRSPRPDRVWNRIPDQVRERIVTLALDEPELSPRELALRFTDAERYFVSEASVYRLLKAHDLITSRLLPGGGHPHVKRREFIAGLGGAAVWPLGGARSSRRCRWSDF